MRRQKKETKNDLLKYLDWQHTHANTHRCMIQKGELLPDVLREKI